MRRFKIFLENKVDRIPKIPEPIHFKYIEALSRGVIPEPIHFKEDVPRFDDYDAWKDTNENSKLGHTSNGIRKKLTYNHDLNDDEVSHINRYTVSSGPLNKNLIKKTATKKSHVEAMKHLDSAISRNPLRHDLHVYSGMSFDPTDHTDEKGRMHSPAYISATHSKDTAHSFTTEHKGIRHIARISLRQGDPALHISPYSDNPHEDETIIKRDVTLQHHGHQDYKDADGVKYRVHHMSISRS